MTTKYENYDGAHYGRKSIYNDGASYKSGVGIPFTVGATGHTVTSVKVYLNKTGAPTGTITVSVRATSGGKPTGGDLCSGTMNAASPPAWPADAQFEISQSPEYTLSPSTTYAICLLLSAGGSNTTNYDAPIYNYPYTPRFCLTSDQGATWTFFGLDGTMLFEVWGNSLIVIPTVTTQAATSVGLD
jgi:hypothetical protein